jgi:hypothetical protein
MVTKKIATARETAAYCHGVHEILQIDCVPLYTMVVEEIKIVQDDG